MFTPFTGKPKPATAVAPKPAPATTQNQRGFSAFVPSKMAAGQAPVESIPVEEIDYADWPDFLMIDELRP